ncbi:hypothetical protein J5N97_019773 [Dioscorea zingiberensis]|uniref:Uncharacterized protein n=1 Tax=Dioscorea zingiberensis TaxID=325984 RepID=A0A9D5CF70_9LILI|nr:hypothetical protein J5N97_019773 [Dioscorea zingiberensis]
MSRKRPKLDPRPPLPTPMSAATEDMIRRFHSPLIPPGRCGSVHVHHVSAPLPVVWSLVCRFDRPQSYKRFIRTCHLRKGDGGVGSEREVRVVTGLPARSSTERLDTLDDERHVFSFSIVGGDHRLANYRSTTTLHRDDEATVVVESYVVDVPEGSTEEETHIFTDTIVGCNLKSLAQVAGRMACSAPPTA